MSIGLAVLGLSPGVAEAAPPTCAYDPGTKTLTIANDGTQQATTDVRVGAGKAFSVTGVAGGCGGATTDNTDVVDVTSTPESG